LFESIHVIDSHTAGEPTRVVVAGGPDLGNGSLIERLAVFRSSFDHFRSGVVNEPRGSDVIVGALLTEPLNSSSAAAVIFFNNAGYLGMCGHGAIGVITTLHHQGRIVPGQHQLETPVGTVQAELHSDGQVSIRNVPSYRYAKDIAISVEGHGELRGDIAWGGNWFFLVYDHGMHIHIRNAAQLSNFSARIRKSLELSGIKGANGAVIDHIELFAPSELPGVDSKNFVLCPGMAYDRSPCGTGTSAKMACLYADRRLKEGEQYHQAGILDTVFTGWVECQGEHLVPTIKGSAYITGEATLLFDGADPFRYGIRVDPA
jgi:4-hydroxyproline epimerase